MKTSACCLKCTCKRLLIIDEVQQWQLNSYPRAMPVHAASHSGPSEKVGKFQVIVCTACGYTEWYAHEIEELLCNIADFPGARIVGQNEPTRPYR